MCLSGYKRVAWPPASEERIVREFTPQPQTQYQPVPAYNQQQQQQQPPSAASAAPAQVSFCSIPFYTHMLGKILRCGKGKKKERKSKNHEVYFLSFFSFAFLSFVYFLLQV